MMNGKTVQQTYIFEKTRTASFINLCVRQPRSPEAHADDGHSCRSADGGGTIAGGRTARFVESL